MVKDAFSLLGLPRTAVLAAEDIRSAFQKRAAASHPDAAEDEADRVSRTIQFQQLNEASVILTPVAARLKHLLALENPEFVPARAAVMDGALVALFTQVGAAVGKASAWIKQRQSATTFLAKAGLTASEMKVQEALEAASLALRKEQEALQEGLMAVDAARSQGQHQAEMLSALAQLAAFLEKWQAQIQAAWASLFSVG